MAGSVQLSEGRLISDLSVGADTGPLGGSALSSDLIFWQHPTNVTIPNATWTPLPWNTVRAQTGTWSTYAAAATTIAAGSNGQALPQATINVASTTGFLTSGYLVVTIAATHRVVRYTGTSGGNQFTGCTLGVGTMTTGDAVAQANVIFNSSIRALYPAVAEVAWASNATGLRGIRFRFMDGSFNLPGGTTVVGAVAATDPLMHIQSAEQPAVPPVSVATNLTGTVVEVYQSSTGNLDSVVVADLSAPRLVGAVSSGFFTA